MRLPRLGNDENYRVTVIYTDKSTTGGYDCLGVSFDAGWLILRTPSVVGYPPGRGPDALAFPSSLISSVEVFKVNRSGAR